jgi:hypothetical protein
MFYACDLQSIIIYCRQPKVGDRQFSCCMLAVTQFTNSRIQREVGMFLRAVSDRHVNFITRYSLRSNIRDVTSRSRTFSDRESKGTWLCSNCLGDRLPVYINTERRLTGNPLTPELNPSVQRYLPRIFTGDFNF